MTAPRESIFREVLKLPEGERVRVVQNLRGSLSPEASDMLDDAWAEELDRRFAAWEADPSAGVPWSELKSQRWSRHARFSRLRHFSQSRVSQVRNGNL